PGIPSPMEDALAESICRAADNAPAGHTRWVVLPLQDEPMRRMLVALRRYAGTRRAGKSPPLRVVCGDGVALDFLAEFAKDCPFQVWGFSPVSLPRAWSAGGTVLGTNAQIHAEIVSSLLLVLDVSGDQSSDADSLRAGLAAMRLGAHDRPAFGRSLGFAP